MIKITKSLHERTDSNERWRVTSARRLVLIVVGSASLVVALLFSLVTVDVTEYALIMRFGRIVRIIAEPGLYVATPFDHVVRLDRRVLFSRPPRSEYLTSDKKNIVVESLATWRIADPQRFVATFSTRAAAEACLSDFILGEIGAVLGRFSASTLISTDPSESRYREAWSEIRGRVANFALPVYGIEVVGLELRSLALPEQNREHVFDRMKAERARMAKEYRSLGEFEARKITAEAEHEKTVIEADAASEAEHIRAQGDAEASRTYAAAFTQDPKLYAFLRTLRAYEKILDEKTTLFLPGDADVLRMLQFDRVRIPEPADPSPDFSTGADSLLHRKPEKEER
jgi:membrane protease subunit HflC